MQMWAQRAGPDPAPGTRWINFERGNVEDGYGDGDRGIGAGRMRGMVLRAGCRMAGSHKADAHRMEIYKDWVWHLAGKARDLNDFKARYAVALTLDEGEADDGMGI